MYMLCISLTGMEKKLKNYVFKCMQTYHKPKHTLASTEQGKEPIIYIRKAQVGSND